MGGNTMKLAPIVLFVYNRAWHTQQTVEALQKNDLADKSELFIYADGEKQANDNKVKEVREYIKTITGFKKVGIIEREKNWGLADNIIDGVTKIVNKYGRIIVLEDDIVTSVGFLKYMNKALEMYEDEEKVMHISGYLPKTSFSYLLPKTFFLRFMSCWGWATWKSSWNKSIWDTKYLWNRINKKEILYKYNYENALSFHHQLLDNIDGNIKTWAIKWFTSIYINEGYCLYSKTSLVQNIGFDGSGIHCEKEDNPIHFVNLSEYINQKKKIAVTENFIGHFYLRIFYIYGNKFTFKKYIIRNIIFLKSNIKKVLKKLE